MEESKFQKKKS